MKNTVADHNLPAAGRTAQKRFTQEEVNRLLSIRVNRERKRLAREYENRIQLCFLNIRQSVQREIMALEAELHTAAKDTLMSENLTKLDGNTASDNMT